MTPSVVVAVDRNPASAEAMTCAADEALARGWQLRIVTVFNDPERLDCPTTFDKALQLQHRLRRQVAAGRPWIDEAEYLIAHGSFPAVMAQVVRADDIVVVAPVESGA